MYILFGISLLSMFPHRTADTMAIMNQLSILVSHVLFEVEKESYSVWADNFYCVNFVYGL
jgi:hypothetical protein